ISEYVHAVRGKLLMHGCIDIGNRTSDMTGLLEGVIKEIKVFLECDAVGIRVRTEEGLIPYQAHEGFSRTFIRSESPLSLHRDQCMCIRVMRGETDNHHSFFTPGGSFCINGTSRFLAAAGEDEKAATRNVCHQHGYES